MSLDEQQGVLVLLRASRGVLGLLRGPVGGFWGCYGASRGVLGLLWGRSPPAGLSKSANSLEGGKASSCHEDG